MGAGEDPEASEVQSLTMRKLAALRRVHRDTVARCVREGRLPCYRVNERGDMRFLLWDTLAFIGVRDN